MTDNISPEEKLLRLIKSEKKAASASLPRQNQDTVPDEKITSDTPELKPALESPLYSLTRICLNFANIQKLIPILLVASIIYSLASFIYPAIGLNKIKLPDISSYGQEIPQFKIKEKPKQYEFYLEGIRQRQIFSSPAVSRQESESLPAKTDALLVKDISLVGIILSDPAQAVIEDKKTRRVYYLSKGQLLGEFQVEDIQEGKIILNYKGQRYELYL